MSDSIIGVVVSHGELAAALVDAAASVTGLREGLVAVSNEGCDVAALRRRIEHAVSGRPAVIFVDLPGGSCRTGAALAARGQAQVAMVAGTSLPMLVDFVFHRDVTPAAAAARAAEVGARAITTTLP